MFLAHFSNTGLDIIMKWPIRKIAAWYDRAEKLHNKLNTPKEKTN